MATRKRSSNRTTRDRLVFRTADGKWANMRLGALRPASLHTYQEQAVMQARLMLGLHPGSRLVVLQPV